MALRKRPLGSKVSKASKVRKVATTVESDMPMLPPTIKRVLRPSNKVKAAIAKQAIELLPPSTP